MYLCRRADKRGPPKAGLGVLCLFLTNRHFCSDMTVLDLDHSKELVQPKVETAASAVATGRKSARAIP